MMKKDYPIIGIAGSNGSGKDTVAEMLRERFGFYEASATDMLAAELTRRGKETTRKNKSALSASWRKQYGMSAIVDRGVEEYEKYHSEKPGLSVGSLRHPGEVDRVHVLGGIQIWTDADPRIRYERVTSSVREGREHEDALSFEDWLADEQREMYAEGDETTLQVAAVREKQDILIENNGNDIEAFKDIAEEALRGYIARYDFAKSSC